VSREPLLSVEDLHVWFDLSAGTELHAVQGVSFDLRPGERMGLVGESGCGKTTTILAMMGLLPSSASVGGRVFLDGENIMAQGEDTVSPHRWKDIAMVFQGAMNAFNPVKTIGSQIVEPMELHGTATGKAARGQTKELLELVGISGDRVNNYPHEFSGGMRQRAAIALALACEPRVLLADEPTGELDSATAQDVFAALQAANTQLGVTMLVVTHDSAVSSQVRRTIAIRDGKTSSETIRHAATGEGGQTTLQAREYATLDRAGRVQLPREMTRRLGLRNRVELQEERDHIGVWPDKADTDQAAGQERQ
jgi:ABC-type glutathione transport system ATPase component